MLENTALQLEGGLLLKDYDIRRSCFSLIRDGTTSIVTYFHEAAATASPPKLQNRAASVN